MKYDADKHHRRSIRLKGYDYSQAGAYFVTICVKERACLFGDVLDGEMRLNDVGQMVTHDWVELPERFPTVKIDEFVVMPNHLHGIIILTGHNDETRTNNVGAPLVGAQLPDVAQPRAGIGERTNNVVGAPLVGARLPDVAQPRAGIDERTNNVVGAPLVGAQLPDDAMPGTTLGDVIGAFKSITTDHYINGVKQNGWPSFPGKLWQRNYYERIIRNDVDLNQIREYIITNPIRWKFNKENPNCIESAAIKKNFEELGV